MSSAKILRLTRRLYPRGLAFKFPKGGNIEKLHIALAISEEKAFQSTVSILNSILPDNDKFTEEDAADWERRFGLINNSLVSLSERKMAILRKMQHPGTIKARQHYLYIQRELRLAGFDVYVYENRFFELGEWITKTPYQILPSNLKVKAVHRTGFQHGQLQHGAIYNDKIANSLDPNIDKAFDIGQNYRSTFFISGDPLGTFAEVESARALEFRQLVLKLKPAEVIAYTFINYV